MKYYVVFRPINKKGIYDNWNDCKTAITGVSGVQFCSVQNREEARDAIHYMSLEEWKNRPKGPIGNYIAVDAACSGCPGPVEYRGVMMPLGLQIFKFGPYEKGTNNVGEFLALVHGLRWLDKTTVNYDIYSDSRVAIKWVVEIGLCKTKMEDIGAILLSEIHKAEIWLNECDRHKLFTRVKKWETKEWGEIPADYGRK
jgi:ribonuclease HI